LYAKSARNRENSVTQQSSREQGGGEGGGSYDLGYAMQRTVINVKKKKDEARTKEGGGVI
jgi:hypothetical protein